MISKTFADSFDADLMQMLLETHGIFVERFFQRSIREKVARRFAEADVDLHKFQRLISSAWGCECSIYNRSDAVYRVTDHIFEQTLIHAISKPHIYSKLTLWFDEYSKSRNCELCGKSFRVIDLPDWVFFGSNGFKYCCFQCCIIRSPKKAELTELIPKFVESCGFIPKSDIDPINFAFTSRISAERWAGIILTYAKMGGINHVKKKFGSWFKALVETGALPDGVMTTARGIRCLASDGHVCHSLDEQHIDNWLFSQKLPHEREPYYPSHPTYNPTGKRRADWKVRDTFIEYFGLVGNEDYDKKIDEKLLLAQYCNIDLIVIYPSDLHNLDKRLECFLSS
ncbi:MAG: hypothetical protein HC810_08325 [Acaryochloridaceae cyanobacterium RL_2_7]|nr:hypothetical protein [Acaryochloridaceae cyanobacterium RL_2_7]